MDFAYSGIVGSKFPELAKGGGETCLHNRCRGDIDDIIVIELFQYSPHLNVARCHTRDGRLHGGRLLERQHYCMTSAGRWGEACVSYKSWGRDVQRPPKLLLDLFSSRVPVPLKPDRHPCGVLPIYVSTTTAFSRPAYLCIHPFRTQYTAHSSSLLTHFQTLL